MSIFEDYYREPESNPHQAFIDGDYVRCNYIHCSWVVGPFDELTDAEEAVSEHEDEMAELCIG